MGFKAGNYNLLHVDTLALITKGLQTIANLWDPITNQFLQTRQIAKELEFSPQAMNDLKNMVANLEVHHRYYLELLESTLFFQLWIGGYQNKLDEDPM